MHEFCTSSIDGSGLDVEVKIYTIFLNVIGKTCVCLSLVYVALLVDVLCVL